jgi:8-oxo-dGTP pyrophosphatase MutT (NUDIX family)
MSDPKYNFQYCLKAVLFSEDWQKVLLAKRYGEADYDGTFSFIGGKMETTDESIVAAIKREKDEEIGETARVRVHLQSMNNVLFRKKDGSAMIVPHYIAQYLGGDIKLNAEEYSEYAWVPIEELATFEPKIANIPEFVAWASQLRQNLKPEDFTEI